MMATCPSIKILWYYIILTGFILANLALDKSGRTRITAKLNEAAICIMRMTNCAYLCMHENVFKDHVLKYVRQN